MTTKSAPCAIEPGDALEGTKVDVEVEGEPQSEKEAPFEGAGWHGRVTDRRPDRSEKDGVVTPELLEHLIGKNTAVAQIAGGTQVEFGGLELDARGGHHFERLRAHLGPDAIAADDRNPLLDRACAH